MKAILYIMILCHMVAYGGGGVIVTQGDCCSGGGTGGAADGVGIYNARALNMLSNDDDSTIVDGGTADRNTTKILGTYSYNMYRSAPDSGVFIRLMDTYDRDLCGDMYQSQHTIATNILSYNSGAAYNNGVLTQNYNSLLLIDSTEISMNNSSPEQSSYIKLGEKENYPLEMSVRSITNDKEGRIQIDDYTGGTIISHREPIAYGGVNDAELRVNNYGISMKLDPYNDPSIPSGGGSIGIYWNLGTEPNIRMDNINGNYELSENGTHYFNNSADTITAVFNGDIVCTGVNIPSESKTKTHIKDVTFANIKNLKPKSFNYDYAYKRDTIFSLDTIYAKNIAKSAKSDTIKIDRILKKIDSIHVSKYIDAQKYGFMASDVEAVIPEAITNVNGEKYINYITLTVAAIAQIQAQQVQIDELISRVNKLEKK